MLCLAIFGFTCCTGIVSFHCFLYGSGAQAFERRVYLCTCMCVCVPVHVHVCHLVSCPWPKLPPCCLTPCAYCGFAVGLTGEERVWHCPCGIPYCTTLCQHRHWQDHRPNCPWRARKIILKEWGMPAHLAALILAFVRARVGSFFRQ